MTKKIISVLIALLMAFSLALPTFAVNEENKTLSAAQIKEAVNIAVGALVGAPEGATVIVDGELVNTVVSKANTAAEVSGLLSGFIFIEKDLADSVAADIAENSKYTVKVIADGKQTVYCSIDFDKFPEIYDARVYLSVIDKIKAKCDEVAIDAGIDVNSDIYSAMSYSHIAGELALHMILAKLSKDSASWNPISEWIFERSNVADLNVDESRIPAFFITSIGDFFVNFFRMILSIA